MEIRYLQSSISLIAFSLVRMTDKQSTNKEKLTKIKSNYYSDTIIYFNIVEDWKIAWDISKHQIEKKR